WIGLLDRLRDVHVGLIEGWILVILAAKPREVVLSPELLQNLQELKKMLPPGVIAARPSARTIDKAALAELVNDRHLLRDLEGVFEHQLVKGVAFMGERPRGGFVAGLFEDGAMDGSANLDALGATGNRRRQQEGLRVHTPLCGEVATAQPEVV